jgi:hypothetical protein
MSYYSEAEADEWQKKKEAEDELRELTADEAPVVATTTHVRGLVDIALNLLGPQTYSNDPFWRIRAALNLARDLNHDVYCEYNLRY